MALYSFCVRRKGTNKYVRAHMKHDLPFLDFFAMQFNNKQELIRFLGADLEKYDDVAIIYKNNHTDKILPIYFDSPQLEVISKSMLDFELLADCETIKEALAVAYNSPGLIKVAIEVPTIREVDEIIERIAHSDLPEKAYDTGRMNKKAVEYYEKCRYDMFKQELMRSYIGIRKAYMALRENRRIFGELKPKGTQITTMQEELRKHYEASNKTYDILQAYNILKVLTLTSYEENLIARIFADDEIAYEELMASSADRLEYLKPLLIYLAERRGKAKKIGPID